MGLPVRTAEKTPGVVVDLGGPLIGSAAWQSQTGRVYHVLHPTQPTRTPRDLRSGRRDVHSFAEFGVRSPSHFGYIHYKPCCYSWFISTKTMTEESRFGAGFLHYNTRSDTQMVEGFFGPRAWGASAIVHLEKPILLNTRRFD